MFRSIRWRLQLWHGVILFLVLGGFGYTAFELQRTREIRRIDQELHDHMATLLGPLRRPGRPPGPRRPPFREAAPEMDLRLREEAAFQNSPEDPGPPRGGPRGRPPGMPMEFRAESDAAFPEAGHFYYVVWDREGKIIRSRALPENFAPQRPSGPPGIIDLEAFRELVQNTPRGETVVVGRSVSVERKEMRKLALFLILSGASILALGLAGGWVVATRAMRPIHQITTTAQKIASGDLAQRIAAAESESELGRLVAVLNSTFARLEASFSEQARFTTDVSHELRTPVAVIVSQTQMALARERSAPEYRDALEACQRSGERMRRLIESLLQLARLDAGQEQIRRMSFDLADVARDALDLLRPLAQERNIELVGQLSSIRPSGDPDKVSQVMINLISNAIHHTPQGGRITVATGTENQLATLRVTDTGSGIPPEDLPHIFNRFYRVDASRSRDKGGSGLGLAITRAIVHAHGGTVDVQSTAGQGTTFLVRLPF